MVKCINCEGTNECKNDIRHYMTLLRTEDINVRFEELFHSKKTMSFKCTKCNFNNNQQESFRLYDFDSTEFLLIHIPFLTASGILSNSLITNFNLNEVRVPGSENLFTVRTAIEYQSHHYTCYRRHFHEWINISDEFCFYENIKDGLQNIFLLFLEKKIN